MACKAIIALAVDINGFPQAIHMTRANVSDRDGASAMIALHAMHLRQVQNVLEPV